MTVTVTGEGKTAKLSKPLAPKARASLRLPKAAALPRLGRGEFRGRRRGPDRRVQRVPGEDDPVHGAGLV
jgi:hypothetical protein